MPARTHRPAAPAVLGFLVLLLTSGCGDEKNPASEVAVAPGGAGHLQITRDADGCSIQKDGSALGDRFDSASGVTWSPDGSAVAFKAIAGGRQFIVRDGKQVGDGYDQVSDPVWSPDGRSLAFRARTGDKEFIVQDGSPVGGPFDHVSDPVFAPAGESLAFAAASGGKSFIVKDGRQASDSYSRVGRPVFRPGDAGLAFAASVRDAEVSFDPEASAGQQSFVVIGGKQVGGKYQAVASISFSPDGRHVAFFARIGSGWFPIIDGQRINTAQRPLPEQGLHFSAAHATFLYVATTEGKSCVMRRDIPASTAYDEIGSLAVSPDGRSVAFAARTDETWAVVRDDSAVGGYHRSVRPPVWSPDGRSLAFWASDGTNWSLMLNGAAKLAEPFDAVSEIVADRQAGAFVTGAVLAGKARRIAAPW